MKKLLFYVVLALICCGKRSTVPADTKAPDAPIKLEAFGEYRSVVLKWKKVPDEDVKGYIIYYGTVSKIYTEMINVDNIDIFRISDLLDDTQYFFAVSAFDNAGNKSSFSPEATAITYIAFEDFTQDDGPLDPQKWHAEIGFITPVIDNCVNAANIVEDFGRIRKSFGQYKLSNPLDNFVIECQFKIGFANVGGAGLMLRAEKAKPKRFYKGYTTYLFWNGAEWEFRLEESLVDRFAVKNYSLLKLSSLHTNDWIKVCLKLDGKKLTASVISLSDYSHLGTINYKYEKRGRRPRSSDYFCGFYTCQYGGNVIFVDNFGIKRTLSVATPSKS